MLTSVTKGASAGEPRASALGSLRVRPRPTNSPVPPKHPQAYACGSRVRPVAAGTRLETCGKFGMLARRNGRKQFWERAFEAA